MATEQLQVGVTPAHVIRGALLMRGYTIHRVAKEAGVHRNFVLFVLKGHAKSERVENYIHDLLTQPIEAA